MRALLVAVSLVLAAGPAAAQAGDAPPPVDLAALRAEWPGYDSVILNRTLVVEMTSEDVLRVREDRMIAILQDDAREHLRTFDQIRRPGCRLPSEMGTTTWTREGEALALDPDDLVELPRGDVADSERQTVDVRGPRRGLAPGAVVVEGWTVDYPAGCYGGLLSTSRRLGSARVPVLRERVEVRCAGAGCVYATDRPVPDFGPLDGGGVVLERERILPVRSEKHSAGGTPRLYVSSTDDATAAGMRVHEALAAMAPASRAAAPSWVSEAHKEAPYLKDPAERIGRYLADVELLDFSDFWTAGIAAGDPPKQGERPPSPLEWLALATAALEPHGGVPVLLALDRRVEPPPIGNVVGWDSVGVLVPGVGVATHADGWKILSGPSSRSLAGRWHMTVGETPAIEAFPAEPASVAVHWSGTVAPQYGTWAQFELETRFEGTDVAIWAERWGRSLHASKEHKKKDRLSDVERKRSIAGKKLFGRDIATAEFEDPVPGEPLTVTTIHSREGLVTKEDALTIVAVPFPAGLQVRGLAGITDRQSDFRLDVARITAELRVAAPAGFALAGLPEGGRVEAGSLTLDVQWTEREGDAVMTLAYEVADTTIDAALAADVERAAQLARRASLSYVLFAPTPE